MQVLIIKRLGLKLGLLPREYYNPFVVFILLLQLAQFSMISYRHRLVVKKIIMIMMLCSSIVLPCRAQHPDLIFDHYSVEDGLSQSTVLNIFEDSRGFIWLCTPDGLNKFDGYSFTVYRNIKGDTNSISSNHPIFIFEDSKGDLWIGHRAGLSKYHYGQERFSTVYQLPEINSEYDGLIPLHEADGRIWGWDKRRGIVGFNML